MKNQTGLIAAFSAVVLIAFVLPQAAFAQNTPAEDSSSTPAIAYSEMQSPVPAPARQASPDPIPPTQQQQPEDRPAPGRPGHNPPDSQAATTHPQQDAARTLTGTIVKNGDQFVLTTEGNINFQLDDQERARNYQDKQVKITGTVDAPARKIHVQRIEPIV